MRRIRNAAISQKDRIVCESIPNKLRFSYKAVEKKNGIYLFETAYSPSLYQYFHDNGCRTGSNGYSLTIKQFYQFRDYHNVKLANVLQRVPSMVDFVLMEELWEKQAVKTCWTEHDHSYAFDDARAA